jgi:hypothetical protein
VQQPQQKALTALTQFNPLINYTLQNQFLLNQDKLIFEAKLINLPLIMN